MQIIKVFPFLFYSEGRLTVFAEVKLKSKQIKSHKRAQKKKTTNFFFFFTMSYLKILSYNWAIASNNHFLHLVIYDKKFFSRLLNRLLKISRFITETYFACISLKFGKYSCKMFWCWWICIFRHNHSMLPPETEFILISYGNILYTVLASTICNNV